MQRTHPGKIREDRHARDLMCRNNRSGEREVGREGTVIPVFLDEQLQTMRTSAIARRGKRRGKERRGREGRGDQTEEKEKKFRRGMLNLSPMGHIHMEMSNTD